MDEQLSDAGLVRWALRAETEQERKAAFQAIAEKYRLVVFRQCARWFPDPETAQDVCQTAFEAAFTLLSAGKGPARPDKLAGWLIEIARHRSQQQRRTDTPPGVRWAVLPEGQSLDELEDDEEPRSGSAVRRAQATRLVEAVVATLTVRQQQVYQLRYVQEMTGKQVAESLGVADKTASNEITKVQALIADGFGALILYQEGRTYCPDLAHIIDLAQAAAVGTDAFTMRLRTRIINHFDNCKICDDCRTCNAKRRQLVGPYAPVLIPILFEPQMRDLITETIDHISKQPPSRPNHPQASPPTGPPQATTDITETSEPVALADMETALSAGRASARFTDETPAPKKASQRVVTAGVFVGLLLLPIVIFTILHAFRSSSSSPPQLPPPPTIVGEWSNTIRVYAVSDTSFVGVAIVNSHDPTTGCNGAAGTEVWQPQGREPLYTGAVLWVQGSNGNNCVYRWSSSSSTFNLIDANTLQECSTNPLVETVGCERFIRTG